MILAKLKLWATAIGAGLIIALGFATKFFATKAKKEKQGRKKAEKSLKHTIEVAGKDIETDNRFNSRRAEAKAEIKETGVSSQLSDPNVFWLRKGPDKD